MNKLFTLVLLAGTLLTGKCFAQEPCLSEIIFQEDAKKHPELFKSREQLEEFTRSWIAQNGTGSNRTPGTPYIIPVVFHVIHYGGNEKIGRNQIVSQIDSMNQDFRYHNADSVITPAVFAPLAADCNIEFRLAQKDPSGNCTDGVTYTYSPLTYNARSNVKSLIHWPTNQYLNVYTVSSIITSNGVIVPGSIVAGFAQFPGGADSTDGIVLRSEFVGSIGSAFGNNDHGRTLTHEVGHWLNLRHIWGDAVCGSDLVGDTPPQEQSNISLGCPVVWPHLSNCTGNSPNGDMYVNHMDYTDGACKTMFSIGQSARMTAALNSTVSGRNNLYTTTNQIATGTDGTPAVLCAPHADFIPRPRFLCAGSSISFKDDSWNGAVVTRNWTFQGGTPLNDTSANPTITYNTPGIYDVTLSVTNAGGTDTKTITGMVVVLDDTIMHPVPFVEGFESGTGFPYSEWYLIDTNNGNSWEETSTTAYTGSQSLRLFNFSNNGKGYDEFITPSINLINTTGTNMTFKFAFTYTNSTTENADKLIIYYSTNCGQTWTSRLTLQGTSFPSIANAVATNFVPSSQAQWTNQFVNLSPSSISGHANVRFRFEYYHDFGNNLYIDDLNINGTVGIDELNAQQANVNVFPNPAGENQNISFSSLAQSPVRIELMDVSGRMIDAIELIANEGENQISLRNHPEPGVYLVKLSFGESSVVKKLVIR